jgi:hypothetical protein
MSQRFAARNRARLFAFALAAYVSSACAANPFAPTFGPENYAENLGDLQKQVDAFHGYEAAAQNNDPAAIAKYVQSGLTMSNISCDMWLVSLGRTDRDTSFFKDVLNIVGNLILGISGINGANPGSLARGNLFLGAANAGVDAYRNEFLMGVISDIEVKIKSGRKLAEQALLDDMPRDVEIAKRRLLEYHDTCTPTAIKDLLKTSLAQVAYQRPDTSLTNPLNDARASVLASQISVALYPGNPAAIVADDLYKLWVAKVGAPADTTSAAVASDKAAVASLITLFDAKDTGGQLTAVLKQVGELRGYAKRLDDERTKEAQAKQDEQVQKAQADVDKAAAATAADAKAVAAAQATAANAAAAAAADATTSADPVKKADANHTLSVLQQHPNLLQGLDVNVAAAKLLANPGQHALQMQNAAADLAAKRAAYEESKTREALARRVLSELARRTARRADSGPASITPILVPVNRP